jgi:SAM-dependent methyltransferase
VTGSFYDSVDRSSPIELPRTRAARDLARDLNAERVLDLGSGDGENGLALAAITGGAVVCADISDVAVQRCRDRGLEAHRVALGEAPLPFADGTFDLVHMTEVVEHLVHPDGAMEEVNRVLKPAGRLIISTPNLGCLPNRALLLVGIQPIFSEVSETQVLGRRLRILGQGSKPVGHLRLYTRKAFVEFLALHGFHPTRIRGVAMHERGPIAAVERIISVVPGWAMILVVLAQKSG